MYNHKSADFVTQKAGYALILLSKLSSDKRESSALTVQTTFIWKTPMSYLDDEASDQRSFSIQERRLEVKHSFHSGSTLWNGHLGKKRQVLQDRRFLRRKKRAPDCKRKKNRLQGTRYVV